MVKRNYSDALQTLCRNRAGSMEVFTYFDLAAAVGAQTKTIANIVQEWEQKGLVERLGKGPKNRLQFKTTTKGRAQFALAESGQSKPSISPEKNMWTAMRMLKVFSPEDVAVQARTEAVDITLEQARTFCRMLVRGHEPYLKVRRTAVPGRRDAAYQLIRDTGPLPPREARVRAIYDPNLVAFTHVPEPTQ